MVAFSFISFLLIPHSSAYLPTYLPACPLDSSPLAFSCSVIGHSENNGSRGKQRIPIKHRLQKYAEPSYIICIIFLRNKKKKRRAELRLSTYINATSLSFARSLYF
ncbi:hypothetical protein BDB00DRAFT_315123 [Zychaea mexicana]|uniref:uncharacterized protein n=1 Tax=Zychaea mexicana TaxID=64656 RepID=UPI0022FE6A0E|nr:uncharacterized protein BDB00DRAFT_315123 [Zychaea mexicana]KAI9494421.1 hypothetical protein BDB00DRAFT_315123 [Zychaea mexicana]